MTMNKLIKRSMFLKDTTDNSLESKQAVTGKEKDLILLQTCEWIWSNMSEMRANRKRNFRYVFGDQWGDMVRDERGRMVTERSRIAKRTGGIALQNNHLFKVVNSIVGVYSKSQTMPVCFARQEDADQKSQMMTNALQTNYERNMEKDLLIDAMYETVCGGLPVLVEEWDSQDGELDSYTYKVSPDYFFYRNKGNDPRMWDVDLIGEIRDYTLYELASKIAGSAEDFKQLEFIYKPYMSSEYDAASLREHNSDFYGWNLPNSSRLCRTYHVWTREYRPMIRFYDPVNLVNPIQHCKLEDLGAIVVAENEARIIEYTAEGWSLEEIPLIIYENSEEYPNLGYYEEQYWHFKMLSPDGYILKEEDSPYEHGSHPYIFTAHHYIDGNIYPFIGVIIDQQRYINRLISLHDLAVQNAAKGIKMIPTNVLGGMSPSQFAKQWTEIGGYVFYTPDPKMPNAAPQVVTTNATNIGTSELLQLEVEWINDISTVSGAMQGAQASSGTAAARYAMEMQNSTTSISSLFARFNSFEQQLARKKMKTIHQYYTEPHNISLNHSGNYAEYGMYYPSEVADIDFAVSIKNAPETPVARMLVNDLVTQLWQSGAINAKQLLKYGYFEGSDRILQDLEAQEEMMQQAQQAQAAGVQGDAPVAPGIPTEQLAQIQANADQNTVGAVRNALLQN